MWVNTGGSLGTWAVKTGAGDGVMSDPPALALALNVIVPATVPVRRLKEVCGGAVVCEVPGAVVPVVGGC